MSWHGFMIGGWQDNDEKMRVRLEVLIFAGRNAIVDYGK